MISFTEFSSKIAATGITGKAAVLKMAKVSGIVDLSSTPADISVENMVDTNKKSSPHLKVSIYKSSGNTVNTYTGKVVNLSRDIERMRRTLTVLEGAKIQLDADNK